MGLILLNLIARRPLDLQWLEGYHTPFYCNFPTSLPVSLQDSWYLLCTKCQLHSFISVDLLKSLITMRLAALKWQLLPGPLAWLYIINKLSVCSFSFQVPGSGNNWPSLSQVSLLVHSWCADAVWGGWEKMAPLLECTWQVPLSEAVGYCYYVFRSKVFYPGLSGWTVNGPVLRRLLCSSRAPRVGIGGRVGFLQEVVSGAALTVIK